MLITNVHILPIGNVEEIKNGYIFLESGRIVATGPMENAPKWQDTLDGEGAFALPAFIDSHSHLGLRARQEEQDACEISKMATPQYRIIDSLNLKDDYWGKALDNGVLTAIIAPSSGSVISGQVAAIDVANVVRDSAEDFVLRAPIGVKCSLGENPKRNDLVQTRMAEISIIREHLAKASKYAARKNAAFDFVCESLKPVISRKIPLYIHAHTLGDISSAIRLAEEFNIRINIVHATSGEELLPKFKDLDIGIICGPQINTKNETELADFSPALPAILAVNGAKVAISTNHPEVPIGELALSAAIAVREGMPPLDALNAITINAAEICGIGDILGSLEADKVANILLYQKFPLDFYAKPHKIISRGKLI